MLKNCLEDWAMNYKIRGVGVGSWSAQFSFVNLGKSN